MYDDLVGSFTKSGYVDEETQKNDLAIVKFVAELVDVIPPQRELTTSASSAKPELSKLEAVI